MVKRTPDVFMKNEVYTVPQSLKRNNNIVLPIRRTNIFIRASYTNHQLYDIILFARSFVAWSLFISSMAWSLQLGAETGIWNLNLEMEICRCSEKNSSNYEHLYIILLIQYVLCLLTSWYSCFCMPLLNLIDYFTF